MCAPRVAIPKRGAANRLTCTWPLAPKILIVSVVAGVVEPGVFVRKGKFPEAQAARSNPWRASLHILDASKVPSVALRPVGLRRTVLGLAFGALTMKSGVHGMAVTTAGEMKPCGRGSLGKRN